MDNTLNDELFGSSILDSNRFFLHEGHFDIAILFLLFFLLLGMKIISQILFILKKSQRLKYCVIKSSNEGFFCFPSGRKPHGNISLDSVWLFFINNLLKSKNNVR